MNVVVYGKGVTGQATAAVFEDAGITVYFDDPPKDIHAPKEIKPDFCFICVPTPTGNLNYVKEAVAKAARDYRQPPIVIRSTIPPGTVAMLNDILRRHGAHNDFIVFPEFLREQYAVEDALKRDKAFYGTKSDRAAEKFAIFLGQAKYQNHRRVSLEAAETVKIALNSMLAVKVAFANVLYGLCKDKGVPYDEVVELMLMDGWLHRFGLQVPGRHGRGFSGTCLPKDLGWLTSLCTASPAPAGTQWLTELQDYNSELLAGNNGDVREVLKIVPPPPRPEPSVPFKKA